MAERRDFGDDVSGCDRCSPLSEPRSTFDCISNTEYKCRAQILFTEDFWTT